MGFNHLVLVLFLASTTLFDSSAGLADLGIDEEIRALSDLKSALDPKSLYLSSWTSSSVARLCDGSFVGVLCHENGHVANISLQGKGLTGKLSSAIGGLKQLTGLYLHYNSLNGEVPKEIAELGLLSDLYLNVNNFSGEIPAEIGNMASLEVLQLSNNQFSGSIPGQFGALKKLNVLALQSNRLTGAIPASLGNLGSLIRLDLSFNQLFGSIPSKLGDAPLLRVLDVRNNTLSGNVPYGLKRLNEEFRYENNLGLCGVGYAVLEACRMTGLANPNRPEPYDANGIQPREIPLSANINLPCNKSQCTSPARGSKGSVVIGLIVFALASSAIGVLTIVMYHRRRQRLIASLAASGSQASMVDLPKEVQRKNGSPLISLEYTQGWDPLADYRSFGKFPPKVMKNFRFNLEEVESATQYFSEANLLSKNSFSAIYKGFLRDGSIVAVKKINKSSCKSDDSEFLKGLNTLTVLRHDSVVWLRGFCCSRGRGECFLIYDYIPNGSMSKFLDLNNGDDRVLEWSTRVSIIHGIAKGIEYLHTRDSQKPVIVHQNISADKVLINSQFNPLLSSCGLNMLLTNDVVFSTLKASAAMGYLAPEYASTGKFTEKSDIYAFGVLILQIISGKTVKVLSSTWSKTVRIMPKLLISLIPTYTVSDKPRSSTMLQSAADFIAYVASDSLRVFCISNLIILFVLISSKIKGPDEKERNMYQPLHEGRKSYHVWEGEHIVLGDVLGREVSILVKDLPQSVICLTDYDQHETEAWRVQERLSDEDKLRQVELKLAAVQHSSTYASKMRDTEVSGGSTKQLTYESNLSILEAPHGQTQPVKCDELLQIEGMSFQDTCNIINGHEVYDHVEEDDQFRKRVEAFISNVNEGLRAEMMQATMIC